MPVMEEKQETILKYWTEVLDAFNKFEEKLCTSKISLLESTTTKNLHPTECLEIDALLNEMRLVVKRRYNRALANFNISKLLELTRKQ